MEDKQPHEQVYRSKKDILVNNFIGGIAWSLGTLVGASLVIALIGYILSRVDFIPIIGAWITQIIQEVNFNKPITITR